MWSTELIRYTYSIVCQNNSGVLEQTTMGGEIVPGDDEIAADGAEMPA